MPGIAPEIRQVMGAVSRYVPVEAVRLPDEFFPAHLSVALIDAVCHSRPEDDEQRSPVAECYCRRFGLARTRTNRWQPPLVEHQEPLRDLVRHYDELGVDGMTAEVFRSRGRLPGTNRARAEYVLRLATRLRRMGVEVLQDMLCWRRTEIHLVLRSLSGIDRHIVRTLLNYAGDDDFVWGDVSVCRFVALATGRKTISAPRAANLVRRAAYELVLSPRYLDHQIWRHCNGLPQPATVAR